MIAPQCRRIRLLALLLVGLGLVAGCSPLALGVGAGATVGVAAAEQRGLKQATLDTGIELRIRAELLAQDAKLAAKLGVVCVEGRVLLTGVVQSEAVKAQAATIAGQVSGVREVVNEIQLGAPLDATDMLHDAIITARLRADLMTDSKIAEINYSITTVNGMVYIFGIARSSAEAQRVVGYARATPRVKRIINDTLITGDPRLSSSR